MAFRVTKKTWLATEANRIQDILLIPYYWRRKWTPQSLREILSKIGLDYSQDEVRELNDELHRRGIVEELPQAEVDADAVADTSPQ